MSIGNSMGVALTNHLCIYIYIELTYIFNFTTSGTLVPKDQDESVYKYINGVASYDFPHMFI